MRYSTLNSALRRIGAAFAEQRIARTPRSTDPAKSTSWDPVANRELLQLLRPEVQVSEQGGFFVHQSWVPAGVTDQFLEDADTYHQRYFDRLDFLGLIERCLAVAEIDRAATLSILDIGSGGGSSVYALAKALPTAHVVASDISPQLLGKLVAYAASRPEFKDRICAFCFDLHVPFFRDGAFDLIFGAAILHHLLDPLAALRHVASSLRPGGKIVLVEPMEAGCLLLTSIYEEILRLYLLRGEKEHPIARLMSAQRIDIHARLGVPATKPWTHLLDDKWVFDRPYLADLAAQLGCRTVAVHPAQEDLTQLYEGCFRSLLADAGIGGVEIAPDVIEVLRRFDREMSADIKTLLCPTGVIVFERG